MPHKGELIILIIEDNPGDFALVEEFLLEQIEAPVILHAVSYKEAESILAAKKASPDIILLDLSLPDKTGLSLIQDIVSISSNAPVIVLTGYADSAFGVKSLSMGVSDYLLKDELTSTSLFRSIVYNLERKKITSELAESEKKYSELFHLSPLPMFVFDFETLDFLDVNDAFIKYYGYTHDEILEMNLKEIGVIHEFGNEPLKGNQDQNDNLGTYKHLKKNGDIIEVELQSNFIQYKGQKAKITIATDVTERLNYIKAIEQQNEKLREISWIQSHIVRAPLARIMGLVEIIKNTSENGDEKEKTLNYLLTSANELDEVIKNITDKTRVDKD